MSKVSGFLKKYNTFVIFVVAVVICILISPDFFNVTNIMNIGRQYSGLIIVCMGLLFVILSGGIDLSVGALAAMGSVLVSTFLSVFGFGVFESVALTFILIGLCGLLTGVLVAYARMAPFIATLAMMTIGRGIAMVVANGSPIPLPKDHETISWLSSDLGYIPILVIFAVVVVVFFWFLQKYTTYGRIIMAIGSNETAVRLAGIRVKLYKTSVYVISSLCCALGGILLCSRTSIGSPVVGTGMELDAIAACVIGGASLSGGEGSPVKTVIGVLILALIGNIMNLLAVPSYPQDIIKGAIIILSVLLQTLTSSFKKDEG